MAGEVKSAWGIEIGQAGLKAIRLRTSDDQTVKAVSFDYIPHPKILSQPDAVPAELIEQAVTTFVERNDIGTDPIGISVPGHTSLAKFIKLPPVEPSKVGEIVQYEAKQQIPFDLDEVVWDYQPIGGGVEESGFMLEAEVGLFAMKRDLVYEAMRPLTDQGEEIEVVQLAPLALYNYLSWDVLSYRKTDETPEPPDAEDNYILLDMGADNTTLLVSNGRSIWIRNVPIGGNHFTRALTREMKLTFAKAEHLKCNATRSPDPKAVFQAMRPVFNDYVTEIQRSIGYFGSVNRSAKIKKVIGIGNGFKLAGLQKFLQQNLQYEVERLEHLDGVTGDSVLSDSVFSDNVMTFAVPYGLALQTLHKTRLHTSLLPPEIMIERQIRRKKPLVVGMVASLVLILGIATALKANVRRSVSADRFESAYKEVKSLQSFVSKSESDYKAQETAFADLTSDIESIRAPLVRRSLWLELYKAINECLPVDEDDDLDEGDISKQKKIRIESVTTHKLSDVSEWHKAISDDSVLKENLSKEDLDNVPSGAGYVVTLKGFHVRKAEHYSEEGGYFVTQTLGNALRQWTIEKNGVLVPVGQLGISHPLVVDHDKQEITWNPNARIGKELGGPTTFGESQAPAAGRPAGISGFGRSAGGGAAGFGRSGGTGFGRSGGGGSGFGRNRNNGGGSLPGNRRGGAVGSELEKLNDLDSVEDEDTGKEITLTRTNFTLQFAWVPVLQGDRLDSPAVATTAPEQ